ncbi:MAG TPA: oxidoreductase [Mycobacteriales bacterium]|jgi:NAD(P)-dependent dehydrogenase (short-subunit alcohol dehydrogenase family)|nr:oxidoreductase [Mycobacteriales bacterium]
MTGWSTQDIPSQSGRVAIVTGTNSGLGFVTARELARAGATVVMTSRDAERGEAAKVRLLAAVPSADVRLEALDLASLDSIRAFAARITSEYDGVDLLVNNAGVMAIPRATTADGFEMQLGTNHLGHFALTGLLLPSLLARTGSRVVTVSSTAHKIGSISFDDLLGEKRYWSWGAYAQSKLANLLFAYELQRRLDTAGATTISVAAHPGYASTNLQAVGPQQSGNKVMGLLMNLGNLAFGQSADDGALPQLFAATAPEVTGGQFFGPSRLMETRGAPKPVDSTSKSKDAEVAARLWSVSEELTGVSYDALTAGTAYPDHPRRGRPARSRS